MKWERRMDTRLMKHFYILIQRESKDDKTQRIISAGWRATDTRDPSVHVSVLCLLHHIRLVFHAQSLHRRHHRELQHAEKEGIYHIHTATMKILFWLVFSAENYNIVMLFAINNTSSVLWRCWLNDSNRICPVNKRHLKVPFGSFANTWTQKLYLQPLCYIYS